MFPHRAQVTIGMLLVTLYRYPVPVTDVLVHSMGGHFSVGSALNTFD